MQQYLQLDFQFQQEVEKFFQESPEIEQTLKLYLQNECKRKRKPGRPKKKKRKLVLKKKKTKKKTKKGKRPPTKKKISE